MPITITHATTATKPNDPGKQVSANAWNEDHTIVGLGTAAEANIGTGSGDVAAGNHGHTTLGGVNFTDAISLPKAAGKGILVDSGYGWRDLIGDVTPKTNGVGAPTLDAITGNIRGFRYSPGDDGDIVFHIPHDYVPGTDLYLHPHWTHNGTNISGNLIINIFASFAKGHQQASFSSQISTTIVDAALNITNTPALFHRIPEIQLSTAGGSASMLNTSDLEVDGVILMHFDVNTIPTITGGTGEPYILTFDIHYQSSGIVGTKNKTPSFYA